MTTYVALLRAVNVGGNKPVAMADLREVLQSLGFGAARSLLASGNLVFAGDGRASDLERLLEAEFEARLGLRTDVFVRSAQEWKAIVARNPFADEAKNDPGRLITMFLKDVPAAKNYAVLTAAISGRERVSPGGKHAYIVYPDGVGRSRLTNALIDAKLGTRGTGRNWNTVLKLRDLTVA